MTLHDFLVDKNTGPTDVAAQDIATNAGGLRYHSRAGQIGTVSPYGLPLLRCYFVAVLSRR